MEVGVSYIGCHDCLQEKAVQMEIIELLSSVCQGRRIEPKVHRRFERGQCGTKIHIHISLPCTGGSPVLNFRQQSRENGETCRDLRGTSQLSRLSLGEG